MTQNPPSTEPGAGAPPRPPSSSFLDDSFARLRGLGLVRDTESRWFGGVCSGLAGRLRVDPILIRAAAIILAFVGGIGITAYVLLWLLLPDLRGEILAERAIRHGDVGAIVLLVVAGLLVFGGIASAGSGDGWIVPLWLIPVALVAWFVLNRRGTFGGSPPPPMPMPPGGTMSAPAPTSATAPPRPPRLRRTRPPPTAGTPRRPLTSTRHPTAATRLPTVATPHRRRPRGRWPRPRRRRARADAGPAPSSGWCPRHRHRGHRPGGRPPRPDRFPRECIDPGLSHRSHRREPRRARARPARSRLRLQRLPRLLPWPDCSPSRSSSSEGADEQRGRRAHVEPGSRNRRDDVRAGGRGCRPRPRLDRSLTDPPHHAPQTIEVNMGAGELTILVPDGPRRPGRRQRRVRRASGTSAGTGNQHRHLRELRRPGPEARP
jgi:phage shock protein PspC (stress-responsive transcriptional regulator)